MVSLLGGAEFLENKRNVATVVTSSKAGNRTHGRERWPEQDADSSVSRAGTLGSVTAKEMGLFGSVRVPVPRGT